MTLGHSELLGDPETTAKHTHSPLPGSMPYPAGEGQKKNELGLVSPVVHS